MIFLLNEIHFWTTQEDVIIKHSDYVSFKYYAKKEPDDSIPFHAKKEYCEQRGLLWIPPNKRPQRLRDSIREFEEYLIHNKIIYFLWEDSKLKLLFSNGLIITININSKTGDVTNIAFDKQLLSKLQVNIICDGTIIDNQVISICNDGHLLGFGGLWKDGWILEGGPRRKLNYYGEWLAVWGKAGADHPQPWSPLAKDHQSANLHLYWIGPREPELLAYKKTEGDPLQVVVSKRCSRTLILIEQKVTLRGSVSVEVSTFELASNILKRITVTSVPLQTQVSCTTLSNSEDRLLICCIDGSLALLDRNRGSTRTIKAAFIPTFAVWHPSGAIMAIANERGQLQYYDTALNCVKSQFAGEDNTPTASVDLSSYFNLQFSVAGISWGPKDLVIAFEQGPVAVLTHVEGSMVFKGLIHRYLQTNNVDKAIKLLLSWEFNQDAYAALQKIVAYLMRKPLTDDVAQHLQIALGSYHNSPIPLSSQIRHRFGHRVASLTRRFFHTLVRAEMFETAFLLAVDMAHHDLFMDMYYIAVKIGETEMAAAARAQASALLSRCSSEASNCSRSSCSQCSETSSSSSNVCEEEATNEEDMPQPSNKNDYLPLPLNPDNCLATDFNQPDPTTYKPDRPVTSQSSEYQRPVPRATYVKAPQVPSTFTKTSTNYRAGIPSATPYVPPLPNVSNNTGLPYPSVFSQTQNPYLSGTSFNGNMYPVSSSYIPNIPNLMQHTGVTAFGSVRRSFPPLVPAVSSPNLSDHDFFNSNIAQNIQSTSSFNLASISEFNASSMNKKHQAKVKFSDTVTAFIVPEVKRPQRPPPPPHVAESQRELADSLPLCHPNEDYLKDFTPVRKEENKSTENTQPPKIKVVHFGVV
ncbi:unnamed protein product [Acanthoscelides obtectus]|uniref:WD repeat-containing and planar cell polarity effector protein fritz n=1 Tax=Acanthoscelides obtectus TaxID=200917 RepID=A0A9P0KNK0_ACAOB|nr:unnamed protein product [Acanthoscelides obtectus]CAK1685092.1 WD repeat-containing and planar cell polarity effector protein fritz [Acanthoscelides obtectus]